MSDEPYKKKLIEVALPLDAINAASAREKSIRHGHPSTLHLWWARRPLAACRAVLFAQLVDDPSAHPDQFPTEEAQDAERQRLFKIIEDLVKWENSTNQEVLEAARAEIRRSCDGHPPPILDPFAGGGSIPLEAQRLGLEAHASDLNPVAVLINKALIEIPPRWADHPPVHPEAENRTRWKGAEGLAEDVRRYGQWMRNEAERRIGHMYPKATLPDGTEAEVIAWIWARTVTCPNPACGATMPLARSFWLAKRKGNEAWVDVRPGRTSNDYRVRHGGSPSLERTTGRSGAVCVACGELAKFEYVRAEGQGSRMGSDLMAVVAEGNRRREYLSPTSRHRQAAQVNSRPVGGATPLTGKATVNVSLYGNEVVGDLFTDRQLTALGLFTELVESARQEARLAGETSGLSKHASDAYSDAIATYLAFAVSKLADRHSMLTNWYVSRESTSSTFQRQALAMLWDYAETNPLLDGTGSYSNAVRWVAEVVEMTPTLGGGTASQLNACEPRPGSYVVSTDPPYYDNISYADLSDYFYSFLRDSLRNAYPELLSTMATPKQEEMVASPHRHGGSRQEAGDFFEKEFVKTFAATRSMHNAHFPQTVFYAFKQTEASEADQLSSTGWATMLEGMQAAGWAVTATWPVRTEAENRMVGRGTNALASSVVLACRPRPHSAGVTDRQGLTRALHAELPAPLRELQKAHIAPVDLRQAAIGPGMAVYSRFAKVIEPDGSTMRVRTALGLINGVLDAVLGEQESAFDNETRWAIHWFSQFYADEGAYGVAEQLAVSMNVAVSNIVDAGILRSGGGKVRLLRRDELPDEWDPTRDTHTPVWEATQHLVKRLEADGEAAAGRLLRRLGGLGEPAQLLAYRLYTVCETSKPSLAGPYNALVASWPEIQRLAGEAGEPVAAPEQQDLGL